MVRIYQEGKGCKPGISRFKHDTFAESRVIKQRNPIIWGLDQYRRRYEQAHALRDSNKAFFMMDALQFFKRSGHDRRLV